MWGMPPYYASRMTYESYRPNAVSVRTTDLDLDLDLDEPLLSVFGVRDDTSLVIRIVNGHNFTINATLRINTDRAALTAGAPASGMSLTSPFSGNQTRYSLYKGGWNSPERPSFISTDYFTWRPLKGLLPEEGEREQGLLPEEGEREHQVSMVRSIPLQSYLILELAL